jgi:hypothetical protein
LYTSTIRYAIDYNYSNPNYNRKILPAANFAHVRAYKNRQMMQKNYFPQ